MQDKIQKQILDAFFVVLRPIAKILLRYGIGFREFSEVAKSAFVDVATTEYGIRGRPTNMSRVAVMTGLTRKEVRRLRDKLSKNEHTVVPKTTPMWDVLHHWHADSEFLDDSGKPAVLPFHGDQRSFDRLVKRFGGDIPAGAMRAELKRVGAIEESEDGSLSVVRRTFRPEEDHEGLLTSLIHAVYPLLSTVNHNMGASERSHRWAQQVAYTQKVRGKDIPSIRRICNDRIEEFAKNIDDSLIGFEDSESAGEASAANHSVAVGFYYFESDPKDDSFTW